MAPKRNVQKEPISERKVQKEPISEIPSSTLVTEAMRDETVSNVTEAMRDETASNVTSDFYTPLSSPRCYRSASSQCSTYSPEPSEKCSTDDSAEWIQVASTRKSKGLQRKAQRSQEGAGTKHGVNASPGYGDNVHFRRQAVGIADDSAFRVVRRLLGPSGENLKHITEASHGAKVWICGESSSRTHGPDVIESSPLRICIRATSKSSLQEASALVQDLLESTQEDFNMFMSGRVLTPFVDVSTSPYACSFKVGIEEDSAFQVVKRLVGKSGRTMKRIEEESGGASVRVCGRRSSKQYDTNAELPLNVRVSATTRSSFDSASASVMALLTRVHADYREFCALNGQPTPVLAVVPELEHIE